MKVKANSKSESNINIKTRGVDKVECASGVYVLLIFKGRYGIPDKLKEADNTEINEDKNEVYLNGTYDVTVHEK